MPKKTQHSGLGSDAFISEEANQQPAKPVKKNAVKTAKQQNSKERRQELDLVKRTFYIEETDDLILEELIIQYRRNGLKADKSTLIRLAIRLLKDSPVPSSH